MPGPRTKAALALLAAGLLLFGAGCRRRTRHVAPPVVINPVPPSSGTATAPPPEEKPTPEPEASPASAPPTLVVPPPKPLPPKPQPAAAPPAEAEPPKPPPPQISPRLSPAQQAEYERATRQAIATAEKNLERAYGKRLNAAQRDLEAKIRGFLEQAHEAIRASDWIRARNLAEKAQVLSVELAGSL